MKAIICKETGNRHFDNDMPCQDAVSKQVIDGVSVICLADGAGSVAESELASNKACEVITRWLVEEYRLLRLLTDDEIREQLIEQIELIKENINMKVACTLLVSMHSDIGYSLTIHVGDGIIFKKQDNEISVLSYPMNGEESNQTYFLSNLGKKENIRIYHDDYDAIFMCSDGISDQLYYDGVIKPAVGKLISWLEEYDEDEVEIKCNEYLDKLFRNYTEDDMSLAIMAKGEE